MKKNLVVIGGGISGIFTSLLLNKKYKKIILVEKNKSLGGFFKTKKINNHFFDIGIHYVLSTNISEIDNLILPNDIKDNWMCFHESLPEGSFFNNKLNNSSGCIDLKSYRIPFLLNYLKYLFTGTYKIKPINLKEQLVQNFGHKITNNVFRDIIYKLTKQELDELPVDFHKNFFPHRCIFFNSSLSKIIKKIGFFDQTVAYEKSYHNRSLIKKYYPKRGGISTWIDNLEYKLKKQRTKILTNSKVSKIKIKNKKIVSLKIDGKEIECDRIIWTAPLFLLEKLINISNNKKAPYFRNLYIINLVIDKSPIEKKNHWINIYQSNFLSYRVTIYSNIQSHVKGNNFRISVEVFNDKRIEDLQNKVFNELKKIKIIETDSKIISYDIEVLQNFLAIPGVKSENLNYKSSQKILEKFENLNIFGREVGDGSKVIQLLTNIYGKLNNENNR